MAWPAPIDTRPPTPAVRRLQLAARLILLLMTLAAVGLAIAGMIRSGRTGALDWAALAVAIVLAGAAGWIVVRPGRSTRYVCLGFLGLLLAGAPFISYAAGVIRLYGFILVNLALLWAIVPGLGLFLRRHLRYLLFGVGLYLIALSFALSARDEWRAARGMAPAADVPAATK
ncbi:MAG: hypothetical protein H0X45_06985 [Planctomycetes bacterium]|nr:hypothetical protein [Planctomycetota bacterium]